MRVLEVKHLEVLRAHPDTLNVRRFLRDFPTSERLSEVKQVVESRAELRSELPLLETAYVEAVRQNPSVGTVRQFLTDFPKSDRLGEIQQAVDGHPKVRQQVQSSLEDAYIRKVQENPTIDQVREYLQNVSDPTRLPELNKVLDKMPQLKRQVQPEIRKAEERRERLLPGRLEIGKIGMLENNAVNNVEGSPPATDPVVSKPVENKPGGNVTGNAILSEISNNMVSVKGAAFTMGCQDGRDKDCANDENPAHQVTLSDFRIAKYEVTQRQWEAVMGENPSNFKGCPDCPVEQVSWDDVQDFLKKLNDLTGRHYRLPTEAEWEYAARGGSKSRDFQYSGGNEIGAVAWYDDNSGNKTHPVGQKKDNALGLYDMAGNVWEWCSDRYGDYSAESQTNPKGPGQGDARVYRGGGWAYNAELCRAAYRGDGSPARRNGSIGFRLARSF